MSSGRLVRIEECAGCDGYFCPGETVIIYRKETYCEECYKEALAHDGN